MNCRQCENRMQQLLDERVNPQLDLTVQRHVRHCQPCRSALAICVCFERVTPIPPHPVRPADRTPAAFRWAPWLLASAALIAVCLLPAWQATDPSPAFSGLPVANALAGTGLSPETPAVAGVAESAILPRLPISFPAMTIPDTEPGFFGPFDLTRLMPERSVKTIRGIPATIESIEPYYRYSGELPVIGSWTHGIHYTLGLIRHHWPGVSPASQYTPAEYTPADLGLDLNLDLRGTFDPGCTC